MGRERILLLIVAAVKKKKELATLDDTFVQGRVEAFLVSYPRLAKVFQASPDKVDRSREFNTIVKEVRSRLRESYGVFIMKGFVSKKPSDADEVILASHRSTLERLHDYPLLYGKIAATLNDVLSDAQRLKIVDLGCGMNPVSYAWLAKAVQQLIIYTAYDISSQDVAFLDSYFKTRCIDGTAATIDLTKDGGFRKIGLAKKDGEVIICFLFKLLDTLESAERHISKKLIMHLVKNGADALVITFPQRTIGGKGSIGENKRWWLEGFLQKEGLRFEKFAVGDEIVYVVKN